MALANDSAVTAAELDELHADLIACRDYLVKQLGSAGEDLTVYDRAADALASLRKQLAEARRERDELNRSIFGLYDTCAKYRAANAQMAAALRRIEQNSEPGSRNNRIARHALGIEPIDPDLTPSSQEAQSKYALDDEGEFINDPFPILTKPGESLIDSVANARKNTPASQEAPASPSPEQEVLSMAQAICESANPCEDCMRDAEKAYAALAPASPSPGLRQAVIEKLTKERDAIDRTLADMAKGSADWRYNPPATEQDVNWWEGYRRGIDLAIRALSRSVSERED